MTAAKAWTSLIITFLTPLLMTYGIGMDTTVEQLITIVVTAVIGAVATLLRTEQASNRITMRRLVRPAFWITLYVYELLHAIVVY
jgi:hypothetical protein